MQRCLTCVHLEDSICNVEPSWWFNTGPSPNISPSSAFFLAFALPCYLKLHLQKARCSFGVVRLLGLHMRSLLLQGCCVTNCRASVAASSCWPGHAGSSLLIFLLLTGPPLWKMGTVVLHHVSCTIIFQQASPGMPLSW